jgi:oxygen-independent coproporphyrinogen-3 oxidase
MKKVSSLYLHVPFCRHLCNYCDFYKQRLDRSDDQISQFNLFLDQSFSEHQKLMEKYSITWGELETIYLGGGTPSLWGMEGAKYFQQSPINQIKKKDFCEFTMEVDPGAWSEESILEWKKLGMNRISMGTQTLNPDFLKIMDRNHSIDESLELLNFCHQYSWNFSIDFLLGLPFSSEKKRDILAELELLLKYEPKHISLYILNARSKYPFAMNLPDDEFIRDEYLLVSEFLTKMGFHHYEVSNFARPGSKSRHNLKYWHSEAVAALGPTGTGFFPLSEQSAIRYKWKVTKAEFEIEHLKESEINLERVYLSLRTSQGWKPQVKTPQLGELFETWEQRAYGSWSGERFILNALGYLMLDSLMDDLFRLGAV